MPTDLPSNLTLALLLTAAGVTVGAALVTGLVELLKSVVPLPGGPLRWAFVIAAVLVIAAYASGVQAGQITISIESIFALVLAWYGVARGSKAIYDDATAAPGSLRG